MDTLGKPERPLSNASEETLLCIKHTLSNRIFLGYYQERRYVNLLGVYRDVVIISPGEVELHHDLSVLSKQLKRSYDVKWIGITGPDSPDAPVGFCFWVRLKNLPFGHYWFQVKHVKVEQGEIYLQLKTIRVSRTSDFLLESNSCSSKSTQDSQDDPKPSSQPTSEYTFDFDPADWFHTVLQSLNDLAAQVQPLLTRENCLIILKLALTLILGAITLAIAFIRNIGDYSIRILQEMTRMLHVVSPIIIKIIDFFTKLVGGLLILIAMLFSKQKNNFNSDYRPAPRLSIEPPPYLPRSSFQNVYPRRK